MSWTYGSFSLRGPEPVSSLPRRLQTLVRRRGDAPHDHHGGKKSIPPAEDTLVCAGQAGGGLHAPVGLDTIESVFVTTSSAPQHGLDKTSRTSNGINACLPHSCF